jgi:hypothetical protein
MYIAIKILFINGSENMKKSIEEISIVNGTSKDERV